MEMFQNNPSSLIAFVCSMNIKRKQNRTKDRKRDERSVSTPLPTLRCNHGQRWRYEWIFQARNLQPPTISLSKHEKIRSGQKSDLISWLNELMIQSCLQLHLMLTALLLRWSISSSQKLYPLPVMHSYVQCYRRTTGANWVDNVYDIEKYLGKPSKGWHMRKEVHELEDRSRQHQ